ncbi:sugar ABC transporter ATP-binding protein [Paenibacillus senegalensis]|uniref:sugar ABC transporter ATP-binding protein n=1 Tax=Paenibacillus senegalensis TaxID=1465766 RepID=UPI000288353E|nr:sugar ABC transporter ATP-binding protein [Paenibacillus senegalensis]
MSGSLLEMKEISKAYFGVKALSSVRLSINRGEVHALMGENGAGKSTLMKILNGLVKPDHGEIYFEGKQVAINSPKEALDMGIAMIHQELNPLPEMTVAENLFLGRESRYAYLPFIQRKKLYKETERLLEEYNLGLKPDDKVKQLNVAQKQMLEIVKALSYNARLIIMDEPTSALSDEEVQTLFQVIKRIKAEGVPVIYISHRMEEIFALCDRVTVLRDGEYIGTKAIEDLDKDSLITMMVGRPLTSIFPKAEAVIGEPVLEVKGLGRKGYFRNIHFHVKQGEIVGIAGLMGAGRSEVMRAIFGLDRPDEGEIWIDGVKARIRHPMDAIRYGLAMVTEDRKEQGLMLNRSIKENISLSNLSFISRAGFIRSEEEKRLCEKMMKDISIKASGLGQEVSYLSGGNQQKVVLAKWLVSRPKVLILDEPTRGIDVKAKAEIYRLISEFAKEGMCIVMVSSELPEIMGMSDRILVMGEGEIRGEFHRDQVTQEEILECALGGEIIVKS